MTSGSNSQFDLNHWIYRIVAFIIDCIIVFIPAFIIYSIAILFIFVSGGFLFGWAFYVGLPFLLGILLLLYSMFMDASYGGTLGKRFLGLHVQMVNGSRVTFDKAFIRNISKIYWLFLLLDWLLGILIPGQDQRQKYTDRIAGTTVVLTRTGFSTAATPPPPASSATTLDKTTTINQNVHPWSNLSSFFVSRTPIALSFLEGRRELMFSFATRQNGQHVESKKLFWLPKRIQTQKGRNQPLSSHENDECLSEE